MGGGHKEEDEERHFQSLFTGIDVVSLPTPVHTLLYVLSPPPPSNTLSHTH